MLPLAVPVPDRLAQTVLARMGGPGNELVCPGTLEGVLVSWCPGVLLWSLLCCGRFPNWMAEVVIFLCIIMKTPKGNMAPFI
jgi:hypothetical protein